MLGLMHQTFFRIKPLTQDVRRMMRPVPWIFRRRPTTAIGLGEQEVADLVHGRPAGAGRWGPRNSAEIKGAIRRPPRADEGIDLPFGE